jgi:F-type H+-transporting ATPase subunit epsilon
MTLHVDVITPEKLALSDEVDFIAAPATDGEVGILPHHTPLLTRLGVGELRLKKGEQVRFLAVSGGFMEVQTGSRVAVFAETAELAEEIDEERARQAAERAKTKIQQQRGMTDVELIEAEASLDRALLRLKLAQVRRSSSPNQPPLH